MDNGEQIQAHLTEPRTKDQAPLARDTARNRREPQTFFALFPAPLSHTNGDEP